MKIFLPSAAVAVMLSATPVAAQTAIAQATAAMGNPETAERAQNQNRNRYNENADAGVKVRTQMQERVRTQDWHNGNPSRNTFGPSRSFGNGFGSVYGGGSGGGFGGGGHR